MIRTGRTTMTAALSKTERSILHVSCVTCHIPHVKYIFFLQSGGAIQWMVCYQRGLPRLVFLLLTNSTFRVAWNKIHSASAHVDDNTGTLGGAPNKTRPGFIDIYVLVHS